MTYPLKFRQKVFAVKEKNGLTYEQTSERFDVSIRTLFRWELNLEPKKTRNRASKIDMTLLEEDLLEYSDDYLWERAKRFNVAKSTMFYAIKRLGITCKKNTKSSQSK